MAPSSIVRLHAHPRYPVGCPCTVFSASQLLIQKSKPSNLLQGNWKASPVLGCSIWGVCSITEQVSRAWFIREKSIYPRKSESKTKFLGDSRATTSIKSLSLPKSKNTQDRWSCTFFNIDSWGLTPFLKNEHWILSHCWWERTKQSCFLFLRLQIFFCFSPDGFRVSDFSTHPPWNPSTHLPCLYWTSEPDSVNWLVPFYRWGNAILG